MRRSCMKHRHKKQQKCLRCCFHFYFTFSRLKDSLCSLSCWWNVEEASRLDKVLQCSFSPFLPVSFFLLSMLTLATNLIRTFRAFFRCFENNNTKIGDVCRTKIDKHQWERAKTEKVLHLSAKWNWSEATLRIPPNRRYPTNDDDAWIAVISLSNHFSHFMANVCRLIFIFMELVCVAITLRWTGSRRMDAFYYLFDSKMWDIDLLFGYKFREPNHRHRHRRHYLFAV